MLSTVHICDVPLQDILRVGGLVADKAATADSKHDKPADVLKDSDRTAAGDGDVVDRVDKKSETPKKTARSSVHKNVDDDDANRVVKIPGKTKKIPRLSLDRNVADADEKRVDKISDKPKKTGRSSVHKNADDDDVVKISEETKKIPRLSLDRNVADADERIKQQNVSADDKQKRRRQRSSDVQADGSSSDKILSSPAEDTGTTMTGKETVSDKGPRRRRSRQSTKATTISSVLQLANERLDYGSGMTKTAGDVSYGSEAMEDVIQRLLDNDELMDDVDQPSITSPPSTSSASAAARASSSTVSPDRRSRDVTTRKPGKSPRLSGSAQTSSAKLPASTVHPPVKSPVSAAPTPALRGLEIPAKKPGKSPKSGTDRTSSAKSPALVKSQGSGAAASVVGADATDRLTDTHSDTDDSLAGRETVSSGPRIKHVCRYKSIALGKPLATFPPVSSSQLHLSALPSQEKEHILVDKSPGMYITFYLPTSSVSYLYLYIRCYCGMVYPYVIVTSVHLDSTVGRSEMPFGQTISTIVGRGDF